MQIPQIFINIKSYSLIFHKPDSRGRKSDINLSYCWSLMHGILLNPYFLVIAIWEHSPVSYRL